MWFYQSVTALRQFDENKNWMTIKPSIQSQSTGAEDSGLVYCPRYGSRGDCIIAFSGYCDNMEAFNYLKELNIFDVNNREWRTIPYTDGPDARVKCAMIYVPQRNQVIMYGGRSSHAELYDMWTLDLRDFSWRQVTKADVTGDAPQEKWVNRQLGSTIAVPVFDDGTEELLLYMFNGETLHWTSYRTPLKEKPNFLALHEFEGDARDSQLVLFTKCSSPDYHVYLIDTKVPELPRKLHSMAQQRLMCDIVIDFSA